MLKLNTSLKLIAPSLLACAALAGGCGNAGKKNATATSLAAAGPMKQAASGIPVAPQPASAPPVAYTPPAPPQPVVYDPAAEQPVIESEPIVDASDSVAPVTRSRPRRSTESSASAAGKTKYKVKKGESLWSIAQAKYGNGNKWKAIAAANPKIDPNRVQAGQTITLP